MTRLTRDDLSVIEGEARVSCRRLAEVLGYKYVKNVHALIDRHFDELGDFGEVFTFEGKNPSAKGGRPQKAHLLNEHQAVALCMWASTAKAREARMQIVEVFVAWKRGDLYTLEAMRQRGSDPLRTAPDRTKFAVAADHAETVLRQLRALSEGDAFLAEVTHLDIWPSSRRPRWWHDIEVREFLTISHRQMSTVECARVGRIHYGSRCPGKSAVGDYWLKLDEARTGRKRTQKPRQHRTALPAPQA